MWARGLPAAPSERAAPAARGRGGEPLVASLVSAGSGGEVGSSGAGPAEMGSMLKLSGAEHLPITVKDSGAPARAGPIRPWRRRLVLVVAAVAVGSALGACGGGTTKSTGGTPILN